MKKSNNNENGWNDDSLLSKLKNQIDISELTISDYSFNSVLVEYGK